MTAMEEDEAGTENRYRQGESLARLADLERYDAQLRWSEHRRSVNKIFSEGFMMALSALLIPILLVPFLVAVPPSIQAALEFLYYVILFFFILEYALKLYYSEDRRRFVLSPVHLFDLFVIVASLAATMVALFPEAGGLPILLRLLRLPVAIVVGGRTISRGGLMNDQTEMEHQPPPYLESMLLLTEPGAGWRPAAVSALVENRSAERYWHRLTRVADEHLPALGRRFGLSGLAMGGRLWEWAYPRAEETGGRAAVFLQVPVMEPSARRASVDLIRWVGILIIDNEEGLITIGRRELPFLDDIPGAAVREGLNLTTPVILYLLVDRSLAAIENHVEQAEVELSRLEAMPMSRQPRAFLSVTYGVKKDMERTLSWLAHTREVIGHVIDRDLRLSGWTDADEIRIRALLERLDFLREAAKGLAEGLASDIDFYLNTTSFQMNKVMKVIAVLTALTIIPTVVGGLLGMNIAGSPWSVSLAEVVTAVGVIMLFTAWIYFSVGWLKG